MAPFSQATKATRLREEDGWTVYGGEVDPTWLVFAVPNGGYVLALIVEACLLHQASSTAHRECLHLTAHYLRTTSRGKFEVRVRVLKAGRGFANLVAELVQSGTVRVMCHLIFGSLTQTTDDGLPSLAHALAPGAKYARRSPFLTPPSSFTPKVDIDPRWSYGSELLKAHEPAFAELNAEGVTVKDAGLQTGTWCEWGSTGEGLSQGALCFFVDAFRSLVVTLPGGGYEAGKMWFPTMVLSLQFLAPIPRGDNPEFAPRTVGVYSRGNFLHDPQNRHDAYVEVWTAPCSLKGEAPSEGWQDKMICLAVSTQMALAISGEVNRKLGARL